MTPSTSSPTAPLSLTPATVKDVDLINVQVAASGGASLDALLFDGVGAIHSKDSVAQLTINNLKLGTKVGLNNTGANGLTASFTGTSGTSDEVTVELNKAGNKSGTTINRATVDVSSGNSIEAVKVNVLGGDNYVTINGGTVNKTLTITGDGTGVANINTTNVVTTVDASAYKGKLDLTLGGTSNVKVTGTAQDDAIRLGTTLNSADTITGGDGNDTLYATLSATQTPTVSGVEKGVLTFTGTAGNYNASKTTGMTSVDLVMGKHLSAAVLEVLQRRRQAQTCAGQQTPWVFANPKTGRPFHSRRCLWVTVRDAAGLPGLRLHDLRHSFASALLDASVNIVAVKEALGHTQLRTTMKYLHITEEARKQTEETLSQRLQLVA